MSQYDLIFVGGGLASGLAAYRIHQFRPELQLLIIEAEGKLGGRHTWSFYYPDLTLRQRAWLTPFISKTWSAYDVKFPEFSRRVFSNYFSIQSQQFHDVLQRTFGSSLLLNTSVKQAFPDHVMLESGVRIRGRCVLDGRGWEKESARIPLGYQKFYGLDVTLTGTHGLNSPLLMDATLPQDDGFRFFYVLPWSEKSLLVKDMRYSDSPELPESVFKEEILKYIEKHGWEVASINKAEKGILPISLEGSCPYSQYPVPVIGRRAGLFHATTGYSLPYAVRCADALAELGHYNAITVYNFLKEYSENHWRRQGFFRLLNRMLFRAGAPQERFRILQKFYQFSDDFISRFYAGHMRTLDRVRVFTGHPPRSHS